MSWSATAVARSWLHPVAPRRHEEDELQRAIVAWLGWALPADALCYAVPNGGRRHKREAARLKGLGVVAGVPDLAVVWRGRALFIELKARHGALSPAQRAVHLRLRAAGAPAAVAKSIDEVAAMLREQGVPLRARVA